MNKVQHCSDPPPWEALLLVSYYLDPHALALASCVSKSWRLAMSAEHLWKRMCFTYYPTLLSLHRHEASISHRRLFSMARSSYSPARPSSLPPPDPRVKLHQITFVVDVYIGSSLALSLVRPGDSLCVDAQVDGVFLFDINVGEEYGNVGNMQGGSGEMKVGWWVVGRGWTGMFGMVGEGAKGRSLGPSGRWFSEELPGYCGCCTSGEVSGLVAEVGLVFTGGAGEGESKLERVKLGLLSLVSWRYVSVNHGLRYLQHFLLP